MARLLPLAYLAFPLLVAACAYLFGVEPYLTPGRIVQYLVYALSGSVIAGGLLYIVATSGGLASRWLVSVMYEALAFAVMLWIVAGLVILRTLYPGLILPGGEAPDTAEFFQRVGYATIWASVTATTISALVLLHGFRRGGLDQLIRPWPWSEGWLRRLLGRKR